MKLKELMISNDKSYNVLNSKVVLDFSFSGYIPISDYVIEENTLILKKGFGKYLYFKDLFENFKYDNLELYKEIVSYLEILCGYEYNNKTKKLIK